MDDVKDTESLTESERELVEQAGWKPGDSVPNLRGTQVGQQLQAEVDKFRNSEEDYAGIVPMDPSTPPLDPPEPVDVSAMSAEELAAAEQTFAEMDELQDRVNAARKQRKDKKLAQEPSLPPSVMATPGAAQAIAAAEHAAAVEAQRNPSVMKLINDLPESTGDMPVREATTPFKIKAEETQPQPQPEISSPEQDSPDVGADLTGHTTYCPRCNFDLNKTVPEPTELDIAGYLACVLDGGRFRKEVSLFGGRITVVFRTLTPLEVDAAISQADAEMAEDKITNILQYTRIVEGYKLVAGIEMVSRPNTGPITFPELGKIAEGDVPPIVEVYNYFNNEVFTTDSLRSIVGVEWVTFKNLVQFLEAKASDPNFFGSGDYQV